MTSRRSSRWGSEASPAGVGAPYTAPHMATLPLKPEYRPTLPQLLAPGWRKAPRAVRLLVLAAAAAFAVGVAALVLTLLPAHISYGGPTPFNFSYRGLQR